MAVSCPECGNVNSDTNKFCSACGARLRPDARGRCPDCGALNPPSNIFCDECGARLVPISPAMSVQGDESSVRGLSLPSKDSAEEDDTPDWLSQLRSGFSDSLEGEDDEEVVESGTRGGELSLDDAVPTPPDEEVPSWLRSLSAPLDEDEETAKAEEPSDLPMAGELPSWLRDALQGSKADTGQASQRRTDQPESVPSPGPAGLEGGELPDWLADASLPDSAAPMAGGEGVADDSPASTLDQDAPTLVPPTGGMELGDLPDWLQDFKPQEPTAEAGLPDLDSFSLDTAGLEPGELPDWLEDLKPQELGPEEPDVDFSMPEVEAQREELLEWLDDVQHPEASEEAPSEPVLLAGDTSADRAAGLPDWVRAMGADEPVPTADSFDLPEPYDDQESEPDAVPDWLRESVDEDDLPLVVGERQLESPDELPGWLQDLGDQEPALSETIPAISEGEAEADQVPDWLQAVGIQETGLDAEISPIDGGEAEPGELPDWLQEYTLGEDLDRPGLAPPTPLITGEEQPLPVSQPKQRPLKGPRPPSAAEASELTDWLGATAPLVDDKQSLPAGSLRGTGPLLPPELPDWLAEVSDTASSELPDWLMQESDDKTLLTTGMAAPDAQQGERVPTGQLPSWLALDEMDLRGPEQEEVELAPADLPDWLQPSGKTAAVTSLETEALPEWLVPPGGLEGVSLEEDYPSGVSTAVPALGLVQAEIPDWLQALKPADVGEGALGVEGLEALEPVEQGGFLDGLRGALAAATVVAIPSRAKSLPKFVITEQQQAHAQVLERVIHAGAAPKPEIAPQSRAPAWLERGVIPLIILIAVLLPALIGNPLGGYLGGQLEMPDIGATYNLVQLELQQDSTLVIAAFDLAPAEAGELIPISKVMLRQLMARRARILTVSTTTSGSEIAQAVMEELAAEYDYQYGTDYLNLGYIPGGAVGLQAFATAPWKVFAGEDFLGRHAAARNAPAAAGLDNSLANINMVFIFTADRDDLVGWMEQVGRLKEMEQVTMVAGVSAGLEAWAQPYTRSSPRQLDGLLSGIPGAAQYELRVNQHQTADQMDDALNLRNSQTMGLTIIIILVAIGLVWGIGSGLVNRRRSDG